MSFIVTLNILTIINMFVNRKKAFPKDFIFLTVHKGRINRFFIAFLLRIVALFGYKKTQNPMRMR